MDKTYPTETQEFYQDGVAELQDIDVDLNCNDLKKWFSVEETEPSFIYWVDKPFEYVRIHENSNRYECVKPEFLDTIKMITEEIQKTLTVNLETMDTVEYQQLYPLIKEATNIVTDFELGAKEYLQITYNYLDENSGFGNLSTPLKDSKIEDISYIDENVHVHHETIEESLLTDLSVSMLDINSFTNSKKDELIDEIVNIPELDTKVRIMASHSEPSTFSIHKYTKKQINPIEWMTENNISTEVVAYLWSAIENNKSILFFGGTASGKTTSMGVMTYFIPKNSRIECVQQYPEISIPYHTNANATRFDNADKIHTVLENALRQRPEYLLYNEIRSSVSSNVFQYMQTGHTVLTTMHADTVNSVFKRLNNPPLSVNIEDLASTDLLVNCTNCIVNNNTQQTISEVYEVLGFTDQYETNTNIQIEFNGLELNNSLIPQSKLLDDNTIEKRKEFLNYLVKNNINDDERIYNLIQDFQENISTI